MSLYCSIFHKYQITDTVDEPFAIVTAGYMQFDTFQKTAFCDRDSGLPNYQVLYIRDGTGIFEIDGVEQKIGRGNIVLFKKWEPQVYKYISNHLETYWVHFAGTDADHLFEKYNLNQKILPIENGYPIIKIIRDITDEMSSKKAFFEENTYNLLNQLLVEVYRSTSYIDEKMTVRTINHICDTIRREYRLDVSNAEYAKSCNMSLSYFLKVFKEVTGTTPQQYKTELRIEMAKNMLLNTNHSIYDISLIIGFNDPLYFSRCFRKNVGLSPSQYKKTAKSKL